MTSTFRHQTDGGPSRSIRWQLIFKIDITMKLTHLLTLIKTIISCITSSQIFLCWNMQISSHLIKKKGLVIKAVNRTAAIYLQTLVRLHAPTQAHQLASWFCQSKQRLLSEVAYLLSSGTSVGGLNSRPMSGQQSHTIFRKRPCIAKKKKKKSHISRTKLFYGGAIWFRSWGKTHFGKTAFEDLYCEISFIFDAHLH